MSQEIGDSVAVLLDVLDRIPAAAAVVAYRPEEVPRDGPLLRGLAALAVRRPVERVTLPPLTTAHLAAVLDSRLAEVIVAGTGGLPYAVQEVVSQLPRQPLPGPLASGPAEELLRQAEALAGAGRRRRLLAQVARLETGARTVLGMLSLLARQAPVRLLVAAASRTPEEVAVDRVEVALAELSTVGLVRLGSRGWATSHDLVRETVQELLDPAERARLHAALAAALGVTDSDPAEVARHLAGAGDGDEAARWFALAAERQVTASDPGPVGTLVKAGLELTTRPELRARLLEVRSRLRTRLGELDSARADLREALAEASAPADRSRRRAALSMLYAGAQDLERAAGLAELAILDAADQPAVLARALETAAIVDMNLERGAQADARFAQALDLYRACGDAAGAARILDGRAMAGFLAGAVAASVPRFLRVAHLFTDSGDLLHAVTPLSTAGHALVFHDELTPALQRTHEAVDLARSLHHREGITYALWHRAEALAAASRPDEAGEAAREALAVAERLGHRGWTATALRALGIAERAAGRQHAAIDAFGRSLEAAAGFPLFASWAASQLALTLLAQGRFEEAEPLVRRSLGEGPPLAQFEARLARAELSAARREPGAAHLTAQATALARRDGHLASAARLALLPTAPDHAEHFDA